MADNTNEVEFFTATRNAAFPKWRLHDLNEQQFVKQVSEENYIPTIYLLPIIKLGYAINRWGFYNPFQTVSNPNEIENIELDISEKLFMAQLNPGNQWSDNFLTTILLKAERIKNIFGIYEKNSYLEGGQLKSLLSLFVRDYNNLYLSLYPIKHLKSSEQFCSTPNQSALTNLSENKLEWSVISAMNNS